jgi:hypothetical protein
MTPLQPSFPLRRRWLRQRSDSAAGPSDTGRHRCRRSRAGCGRRPRRPKASPDAFAFDHLKLIGNEILFGTQRGVDKLPQLFAGRNIGRCNFGGSIAHQQPRSSGERSAPTDTVATDSGGEVESFHRIPFTECCCIRLEQLSPRRIAVIGRLREAVSQMVLELCCQSSVGILSSPDRCHPCQWLLFLTGVNQAAVAVGSRGIGGANPKVFCDRIPLCDQQDTSTLARFAIFRRSNRTHDRHGNSNRSTAAVQNH